MKNLFVDGTTALVIGLGITCTIGYGTILYSFSLLSIEIQNDLGWSREFIFGVYSAGVLITGLVSTQIGKWLDQYGARWPMCIGSVLVAVSLIGQGMMQTKLEFIAFMLLMEAVSILVIYESAFVAITQFSGEKSRKPISQITLIAGFASTIFWPVISELLQHTDWRGIYWLMALLHILVCLPIHWFVLKPVADRPAHHEASQQAEQGQLTHDRQTERLLALAFGLAAFCIVGLQIHIFAIFSQLQVSEQIAIVAGSLIGPFQVLSRLTDMVLGRLINAYQLGLISLSAMAVGLLFMVSTQFISAKAAFLFACFFGIGQGLTNIVRGALPLEIFGKRNYGTITGRMSRVRLVMTAIAPFSFALILELSNVETLLTLLVGCCLLSVFFLRLSNQRRRAYQRAEANT